LFDFLAEFANFALLDFGEIMKFKAATDTRRVGTNLLGRYAVGIRSIGLFLAFLGMLPPSLYATHVEGGITDSSGGVLIGAQVSLLHVSSGLEKDIYTDLTGSYSFPDQVAGVYHISVQMEGFSDASRNIVLKNREAPYEADFILSVGAMSSEISVTAARGKRDPSTLPVFTQQLDEQLLERANPGSTGEAMVSAVGVTVVGSGPYQIRPRLRGLDSSRILLLVDGQRLNNARVATDRAGVEPGIIDPSTIEKIEIVSGTGTSLYGSDALAGAINITTRQPKPTPNLRLNGGLDGFFSSNGKGRRGTATLGVSGRNFAFKLTGSMERFGNYKAGSSFKEESLQLHQSGVLTRKDTVDQLSPALNLKAFPDPFNQPFTRMSSEIPNSQAHGGNLNFGGVVVLSDKQTFSGRYISRRVANVGFPDFRKPFFFQSISLPNSDFDKVSGRYQIQQINDWFAGLSLSFFHQKSRRLLRNEFPVQFPAPSAHFWPVNVMQLQIQSDTEQNVDTRGLEVQGTFVLAPQNVLTAGVTAYRDSSKDGRYTVTQANLIGSVGIGSQGPAAVSHPPIPLGPPLIATPVRVPESSLRDLGVFVQDEWHINRWVRLSGSFRIDGYEVQTKATPGYEIASLVDGANPAIDATSLPALNGELISRTAYTGDIGLVVKPKETFSLVAHYARSYRHPNLEELLFAGEATVGSIVPNILVGPETGDNLDFGLRIHTEKGTANFTYFNNVYKGFISTEIVAFHGGHGGQNSISQAMNFSRVRIQGFEGFLERPLQWGRLVVTPWANFSFQQGQILEGTNPLSGEVLDGTPQDNITPFKMMSGLRVMDSKRRYWADYSNRLQTDVNRVAKTLLTSPFLIAQDLFSLNGFRIHRLGWGVNWNRESYRWGLSFALENLGNKFYREHFQFAPARGRSLTVGMHLHKF
jgi:outer membrane receptor protein involved in Fe transport